MKQICKLLVYYSFIIIIISACNNQVKKDNNLNQKKYIKDTSLLTQAYVTKLIKNEIVKNHSWKLLITNNNGVYIVEPDTKKANPIIKNINAVDFCFSKDSSTLFLLHKKDTVYSSMYYEDDEYSIYKYSFNNHKPIIKNILTITKNDLLKRIKSKSKKNKNADINLIFNIGVTDFDNILIQFNYFYESEMEYGKAPIYEDKFCINPTTGKNVDDETDEYIYEPDEHVSLLSEKIIATQNQLTIKFDKKNTYKLTPEIKNLTPKLYYEVSPNELKILYKACKEIFEDNPLYGKMYIVNADGSYNKNFSMYERKHKWTPTDELLFTDYDEESENDLLIMIGGIENNEQIIFENVKLFEVINNKLYETLKQFPAITAQTNSFFSIEWDKKKGYNCNPIKLYQTKDENFIIQYSFSNGINSGFAIRKRNTTGDIVWEKTFNEENKTINALKLIQTNDSGFIVLSNIIQDQVFKIFKIKKSGELEWENKFTKNQYRFIELLQKQNNNFIILNINETDNNQFELIELDSKGGIKNKTNTDIKVAYESYCFFNSKSESYYIYDKKKANLIKLNKQGIQDWSKHFPNLTNSTIIKQTPEYDFFICSDVPSENRYQEINLTKINKKGEKLWDKCINYEFKKHFAVKDIKEHIDHSISIAVVMDNNSCSLLNFNKKGEFVGMKTTKSFENYDISELIITNNNGLLITGQIFSNDSKTYITRTLKLK